MQRGSIRVKINGNSSIVNENIFLLFRCFREWKVNGIRFYDSKGIRSFDNV